MGCYAGNWNIYAKAGHHAELKQEGLAVASIARDDPSSPLFPAMIPTLAPAIRGKLGSEFET